MPQSLVIPAKAGIQKKTTKGQLAKKCQLLFAHNEGCRKSQDNLSPSAKEKRQIEIRSFEGPLPHPQILSEYNKISPDFAGRIVTMAESEARHRHSMEERALKAQVWEIRLGQILGFLIGTFTIAAGAFCAIRGAQIAGSIIGSSGIVGLVSAFILGRRSE